MSTGASPSIKEPYRPYYGLHDAFPANMEQIRTRRRRADRPPPPGEAGEHYPDLPSSRELMQALGSRDQQVGGQVVTDTGHRNQTIAAHGMCPWSDGSSAGRLMQHWQLWLSI